MYINDENPVEIIAVSHSQVPSASQAASNANNVWDNIIPNWSVTYQFFISSVILKHLYCFTCLASSNVEGKKTSSFFVRLND